MTRTGALVAAIGILAIPTLGAEDPRPPALLQRLLQSQKTWRLLDPRGDLPGMDAESLATIHARPPWLVGDFDRDGRDDVAAVVVSGPSSRRRFGVVAVHAATPRMPRWVMPLTSGPIVGVVAEPFADTVAAYDCTACDLRHWFRWSGRSYEPALFATGDTVALGDDHANGADLLARPIGSAARRAHVPPCGAARVHDVGGRPGARWYFVETTAQPRARGWVTGRAVLATTDCY